MYKPITNAMANVTKFKCTNCGNTNSTNVHYYHGMLGYEALICTCCGEYYNHTKVNPPDEFSKQFVKLKT